MSPVDIIILSYNRFYYLCQMISAIVARTKYPYRIFVVDNASTDERVAKYIRWGVREGFIFSFKRNKDNMVLSGWKPGLADVESELFCISDPDIIVPRTNPCWLTQLVNSMNSEKELVRIGLSLDPGDVPPCWTKKQAKRLSFRTGAYFRYNKRFRIIDVDTTMQIIRKKPFKLAGGFDAESLNIDFWHKLRTFGFSVADQSLEARHLGWKEYVDEPEYLINKCEKIREYPERRLIKH